MAGASASRTIAVSLKVRDPEKARLLGARLNLQAIDLARIAKAADASMDDIREALAEAASHFTWHVDEAVVVRFERDQEARGSVVPEPPYTLEQERDMLLDIGRRQRESLEQVLAEARCDFTFDSGGKQVDQIALTLLHMRVAGVVCRLIAERGSSARVDGAVRAALLAKGFSDNQIGLIETDLLRHAKAEERAQWTVGPSRALLISALERAGAAPSRSNVERLRRNGLFFVAPIFENVAAQAFDPPPHLADLLDELQDVGLPHSAHRPDIGPPTEIGASTRMLSIEEKVGSIDALISGETRSLAEAAKDCLSDQPVSKSAVADQRIVQPASIRQAEAGGSKTASFMALVETLVVQKTGGRSKEWTPKTAHQHRSIAALFVKMAGTDDPARMTQEHIGGYCTLLRIIPTNYGKSSKDAERSLDEILARSCDLDDDEIGLAAPTINRHLTQLGAILAHMAGNGFPIGTIPRTARAKDDESPDEKRNALTILDLTTMFRDDQFVSGSVVVHGASYWMPLLGVYQLLRLSEGCGLLIQDIDLDGQALEIRDNAIRHVKTRESQRRLPLHPELVRLGFLDYVRCLKALGHTLLFPELRLRGELTSLSNLYYKDFVKHLARALPQASAERKSFHSVRKSGNTALIEAGVIDAIRLKIMGHKVPGVNGKHYISAFSDDALASALIRLPNVTSHLVSFPIKLSDGLMRG